jgi:hypothetical protein
MTGDGIITGGSANSTEYCMGELRWVPISSMQAHRHKLQQLYEVVVYAGGVATGRREEWRDVPFVSPDT